jgi:hypothetical protein
LRVDLTDQAALEEVKARRPLDEATAAALTPPSASQEVAQSVVQDEAHPAAVTPPVVPDDSTPR